MDDNESTAPEPAAEPSVTDTLIDLWHREHFAGMPVEVWNASAVAVADLKKRISKT